MFFRIGTFFAWSFFAAALAFGIFWVVPPLFHPDEVPEQEEEIIIPDEPHDIGAYINDFHVEVTPWTPNAAGNPRVQVGVTNIGAQTYDWVTLDISFIDGDGAVQTTMQSGAHSQIRPGDTVNVYTDAAGIENTNGFVSRVRADVFVNDPAMGLVSA